MKRLGWYVSTFTKLIRTETRKAAEDAQDMLGRQGYDRGLLHRECECGCGNPASKPVNDRRARASNRTEA